MKRKMELTLMCVLVIMTIYSVVALATVGRFTQTHAIVIKSDCTDCHVNSLVSFINGKHIGAMGINQKKIVDNFFTLRNSTDIQGFCYSCHIIGERQKSFVFKDFYAINNTVAMNGIDLPENIINSTETESIKVNITLKSISPENGTLTLDSTIQLLNFSGQQNASKLFTNTYTQLNQNEPIILSRDNIYGDYFRMFMTASGTWDKAQIEIKIEEPSTYPVLTAYLIKDTTNFYTLPNDFPMQYNGLVYFHTTGSYNSVRIEEAMNSIKSNKLNITSFQTNDLMNNIVMSGEPTTTLIVSGSATATLTGSATTTLTAIPTQSFSCSSEGAMCHITQRITDLGQRYGINGENFYVHKMEFPSVSICDLCHI